MNTPTFKELVEFIMINKKDKVFKTYTESQIASMLIEGIDDNCLYYSQDKEGNVDGMILAKISLGSRTLWIEENLAMTLSNLRAFAKKARLQFPDFDFQGFKCGKNRNYNRLLNKLSTTN